MLFYLFVSTSLAGHDSTVWKAEFSPSGDILASCSDDRCIKLWGWEGEFYKCIFYFKYKFPNNL